MANVNSLLPETEADCSYDILNPSLLNETESVN